MDTSADLIEMGKRSANILNLSESALRSLKKSDLMENILDLKGKVIVDTDLHKLSNQISKLKEAVERVPLENRKLKCEPVVTKNMTSRLDEKIIKIRQRGSSTAEGITKSYRTY